MTLKYPHVVITAAFCIAVLPLCIIYPQTMLACFFPACFYIGREETQAEQRYISAHGGHRDDCPWYCGLLPESWNRKSMMDWILPLLVSIAFFSLEVAVR